MSAEPLYSVRTGDVCLICSCISRAFCSAWHIVGAHEIFVELAIINFRVN